MTKELDRSAVQQNPIPLRGLSPTVAKKERSENFKQATTIRKGSMPDDSPRRWPSSSAPGPAAGQDDDSAAGPQQVQGELFETNPPPWELPQAQRGTTAVVVFAEAPFGPYDYVVPEPLRGEVAVGCRLRVPLGHRRQTLIGWCIDVKSDQPLSRRHRELIAALDPQPLCDAHLVQLVMWISHYYQARPGIVFDTLIPAGVRAAAGTRMQTYYRPAAQALDDEAVAALTDKQQAVIRALIDSGRAMTLAELAVAASCGDGPIKRLENNGWLATERRRVLGHPPPTLPGDLDVEPTQVERLSAQQQHALTHVLAAIDSGKPRTLLLHGVTGSGKTEVYIRAIEHVVRFGRAAIVLVPEISLTPQTRARFESRFGEVAVLHSQMSPVERHHQWLRIRSGAVQVVVGPRSAVFAPLPRLGLIVIDEEHDGSFKQDTQPRYHARRVAHRRAGLLGIPLVLGSATPSLESFHATQTGQAQLLRLDQRIGDRPMPAVRLVDLRSREDRAGGAMSRPLVQAVRQTLDDGGQVILLLNRRGFATQIQCPACGNVVACPDCDLPLTYHRDGSKAVCHYCDYTIAVPPACPACGFAGIRYGGLGTQRLEAEVKARFPDFQVARMDSDTMRRPGSHQRVLGAFRQGKLRILLGTQMIAKGLDFPNVLLVGVINADSALHFPDFRAAERTFQLVTQVAGRTGRGDRGGEVIVQTFSPDHPAIIAASQHDYDAFFAGEMVQRRKFRYPPLGSVARIIIRGAAESLTEAFAQSLYDRLDAARKSLGAEVRLLGPAPPPIVKIRGKYRFHILLQSTDNRTLGQTVRTATADCQPPGGEDIQFVVDIDPMEML